MNNEIEITTHVEFKSSESHDSPFAGYKDIDVVFKMPVKELLSPKIIIIAEDTTKLLDDDIQETQTPFNRTKTITAYGYEKTLEKKTFLISEGATRQLYRPDDRVSHHGLEPLR